MNQIKKVESVCPECNRRIKGEISIEKNKVYMIKTCPEHGTSKSLVDKDIGFYKAVKDQPFIKCRSSRIDIPVTQRCNLNCSFCYYPDQKRKDMDISGIENIIDRFKGDFVSISGGEPTLREDLPNIIKLVIKRRKIPILNTNGIKMADNDYVKSLKKAGLRLVHFSLNGIKDDPFIKKNKEEIIKNKLQGLNNLIENDFSIVLSFLLLKNKNEEELKDILSLALFNHKSVFEVRVRSANIIGRHEETEVYSTSEILSMLCNIIGEDKNNLVEKMRKLKGGKCLCKFSGLFYFDKTIDKYMACRVYNRLGKRTFYSVLVGLGFYNLIRVLRINYFEALFNHSSFIRSAGLKQASGYYFSTILRKDRGLKSLRIEIRSWPNKNNLDFEEVENCPSLGLSEDNKKILPFCYRFFSEDETNLRKNRKCMY